MTTTEQHTSQISTKLQLTQGTNEYC